MRRKSRPLGAGVPEQLCRFVGAEWPGRCVHEQLTAWRDACGDWLAADSAREPRPGMGRWWLAGGSRRRLPFGEHGDVVDLLREDERLSRLWPACPSEVRPGTHWTNGPPGVSGA